MICSVGKSEKAVPVLFDFMMALTSAAQLMFYRFFNFSADANAGEDHKC